MIKVGLTGNMGSGKSIIASIFEVLGVPVFIADLSARRFLNDPLITHAVIKRFGQGILKGTEVDRRKMADIVFTDPAALNSLQNIIHPKVREDFMHWCELHNDKPYIIQEAAVLFESGFTELFDKIITVSSPESLRVQRITERDGLTRDEILMRMAYQWDQAKKEQASDWVIINDGTRPVIPQVLEIHRQLLQT
ncbi:MAG: dephospho-CoA kinase [Bacteroidales bacterium]|nr:dephospho-CoA kinase [Bacteroidales bacterium]